MEPGVQTWEVIVVDDGGEPPAADLVGQFSQRLPVRCQRQSHQGPAAARNFGAKHSRGRFLAFLDDDCQVAGDWLIRAEQCLGKSGEAAIGGETINALTQNPYAETSQMLVDYLYAAWRRTDKAFFTSNHLLMPRAGFWEVGGFDERFPLAAAEDRDLGRRWLDAGKQLTYEPGLRIFHRHPLQLRTFWRQHLNYGRGAYLYWQARRQLRQLEPLAFYLGMLAYPWKRQGPCGGALRSSALICLSQLANLVGYGLAGLEEGRR